MSGIRNYMPQLDGLRALAVGAVLFSHWVPSKFQFDIPFGYLGVLLFFVLSGFLITSGLIRSRNAENPQNEIKKFYIRRVLRIFPLYYFVILLAHFNSIPSISDNLIWHATYTSNFLYFFNQSWPQVGSHLWSLSVEEQFYLFWPFLMLLTPKSKLKRSLWAILIFSITLHLVSTQLNFKLIDKLPLLNLDALVAGGLVAFYKKEHTITKFTSSLLILVMGAWLLCYVLTQIGYGDPLFHVARRFCMIAFFVWLISNAAVGFENSIGKIILNNPLSLFLGKISYGIYLWHGFIELFFDHLALTFPSAFPSEVIHFGISALFLKIVITIGISTLSWYLLESPFNNIKKRFS